NRRVSRERHGDDAGPDPLHVGRELPERALAREVVEHDEAALFQVRPQSLDLLGRRLPLARLREQRDRVPEQLGVAQPEHVAAITERAHVRELREDAAEVALRERVVVMPWWLAEATEAARVVPYARELERAVILRVVRPALRSLLGLRSLGGARIDQRARGRHGDEECEGHQPALHRRTSSSSI